MRTKLTKRQIDMVMAFVDTELQQQEDSDRVLREVASDSILGNLRRDLEAECLQEPSELWSRAAALVKRFDAIAAAGVRMFNHDEEILINQLRETVAELQP